MIDRKTILVCVSAFISGAVLSGLLTGYIASRNNTSILKESTQIHTLQLISLRTDIENRDQNQRKVRLEALLTYNITQLTNSLRDPKAGSRETVEVLKRVVDWRKRNSSLELSDSLNIAIGKAGAILQSGI